VNKALRQARRDRKSASTWRRLCFERYVDGGAFIGLGVAAALGDSSPGGAANCLHVLLVRDAAERPRSLTKRTW
jgi:hypothetical protein